MDTGTSQVPTLPLWAQIPSKRSFVLGTGLCPRSWAGGEFLLSMGHFGCTAALELCGATKMWCGCARFGQDFLQMPRLGEEQHTGQQPPRGPAPCLSLARGMTCSLLLEGKLGLVAFNSYPLNLYRSLATVKIYPPSFSLHYQNCCLFFLSLTGVSRRVWGEEGRSPQQLEGTRGRDAESSGTTSTLGQTSRTFRWPVLCQPCSPSGFRYVDCTSSQTPFLHQLSFSILSPSLASVLDL